MGSPGPGVKHKWHSMFLPVTPIRNLTSGHDCCPASNMMFIQKMVLAKVFMWKREVPERAMSCHDRACHIACETQ